MSEQLTTLGTKRVGAPTPPPAEAGPTERPNAATVDLDLRPPLEVLQLLNAEDRKVPLAVAAVLPEMARAVELMVERLERGGRVHYFGAGTSGRTALADAAELPPTFGVAPDLFTVHQAGGNAAMVNAVERAEDDDEAGAGEAELLGSGDVAIGIAASGSTPFVAAALRRARARGAATILVSSSPGSLLGREVDVHIAPDTGPEALAGSTRMKAGSAAKLVLNGLSTATMVALGKTFSHYMVSMQATNAKLRERSLRILHEATGCARAECEKALAGAGSELTTALTMLLAGCDPEQSRLALTEAKGRVRGAVALLTGSTTTTQSSRT